MTRLLAFAALLLVASLAAADSADGRLRVALLDLKALGDIDPDVPQTITALASAQLARTGVLQPITSDEIRQLLSLEATKMAAGCDDAACIAEIGGALGAPYVVSGTVGRLGATYVLTLTLMEITKARAIGRETVSVRDAAEIPAALAPALARLFAPVMYAEAGVLAVTAAHEGATVKVDGVVVGTVPLANAPVAAGPRTVSVTKDGFVEWRRDVVVQPKARLALEVVLVPSREFVAAYEERAGRTRLGAWLSAAGALVAAGASGGLFLGNQGLVDDLRTEQDLGPDQLPLLTREQSDQLFARDAGAFVLVGTGALLAGVSVYLFATGEPPGRWSTAPSAP